MLDLGVDGGKSAVDIPVVGPFEACFHLASLLGDRFGLVVYHPRTIPFTRAMARRLGMESRIAGIRGVGFSLPDIAANREQMINGFIDQSRALIEQDGAEVIIPMGVTQCPVQMKPDWLQQQLGVPVVEGFGAPIRMAALLVSLGLKQRCVGPGREARSGLSRSSCGVSLSIAFAAGAKVSFRQPAACTISRRRFFGQAAIIFIKSSMNPSSSSSLTQCRSQSAIGLMLWAAYSSAAIS